MANFETAGMVFRNPQAIYGSVAMGITKGSNSYRMVTDYRAVNDTIEPAAMPMPNLEDKPSLFAGTTAWCTPDMLQGYLLAGAAERGRPRDVHHGHAGGVVHPAPCSAGGAERYRIFAGDDG